MCSEGIWEENGDPRVRGEGSPSHLWTFLSPNKGCGEPGLGVCLLAELLDPCVPWAWLGMAQGDG